MPTRVVQLLRWCGPLAGYAATGFAAVLLAQSPAALPQAQTPPPAAPAQSAPASASSAVPEPQPATSTHVQNAASSDAPPIGEDEMRQQLEGKTFYLRGGWLDNNLHFNDHGQLDGSSPKASYTLSLVQITRVHLDKHHLELEGIRYGLHFLGAAPFEDQAVDRVRLTSKKKPLRITIDREQVVIPKKKKPSKQDKQKKKQPPNPSASGPGGPAPAPPLTPAQIDGAVAAAPPAVTGLGDKATVSQAVANKALRDALDAVFASGIDQRMIATLPAYWQLYYKDVAAKTDFRPSDPDILRQSQVDKKARLVSIIDPQSNDYAQKNGVAGMSMYHVVVEPDGKAGEVAIGRPIGFGLDESAVDTIRKAKFDPAIKDGKAVPVVLDLVVEFRIYSKLTNTAAAKPAEPAAPVLPGPYSANQPKPAAQPQPQ